MRDYKPVNCHIDEREISDYYDSKTKKKKRDITIKKTCDLVPVRNESKKLSKNMLKEIIKEVIQEHKDQYRTKYRDEIFPGWKDLQTISRVIEEEDEIQEPKNIKIRVKKKQKSSSNTRDKGLIPPVKIDIKTRKLTPEEFYNDDLEEACGDDIAGNRLHNADGEWTDKSSNTSWSLQDKGCGANKMKPGSKVRRWTKVPCGRAARRKGKNIRCRDGKELPYEE